MLRTDHRAFYIKETSGKTTSNIQTFQLVNMDLIKKILGIVLILTPVILTFIVALYTYGVVYVITNTAIAIISALCIFFGMKLLMK